MRSAARITLGSCLVAAVLCAGTVTTASTGIQHVSEPPAPTKPMPLPSIPIPWL